MKHKFVMEDSQESTCSFCLKNKSKWYFEAESTICTECLKVFRDQINKILKIELLK